MTPATCHHGGHSYPFGTKFSPEENPCLECVCEKGFDGTLKEPWCQVVNCAFEVFAVNEIRKGCVPVHVGPKSCCAYDWRCPNTTDSVIRSSTQVTTKASDECVFGKLRLKLGDKLNSKKPCIECKCAMPPHVTCVEDENCQDADHSK